MKKLFIITAIPLLFSCSISKELQVEEVKGKVTDVQVLSRYTGDLKRIEWTLTDNTKRYEYISADEDVVIGSVYFFLVNK